MFPDVLRIHPFQSFTNQSETSEPVMKIFSLPTSLSCSVLSSWIELKSFVRLDSAMCSATKREKFQDLQHATELVLKERLKASGSAALKWLLVRKIKIESLELGGEFDDSCLTQYLHAFGQHLRKVVLKPGCTSAGVALITSFCRKLQVVHGSERNHALVLCELLKLNPAVTELRVEHLRNDDIACFDSVECVQLQRLSLSDCAQLSTFPCLTLVGPALRRIHLENLPLFKHDDFMVIGKFCSNLQSFGAHTIDMEDRTIAQLSALCPTIEYLDLAGNYILTDVGVLRIAQNLTRLHRLVLVDCPNVTRQALHYVVTHSRNTIADIWVDADKSKLQAVKTMLQSCTKLHSQYIAVTTEMSCVEFAPVLACASQLQNLGLIGTVMSDDVLCLVGEYCHELRFLFLYTYDTTSEGAILDVAPSKLVRGCPHLQEIVLNDVEVIPSAARHLWKAVRPQLTFTFAENDDDRFRYNICDHPEDEEEGFR